LKFTFLYAGPAKGGRDDLTPIRFPEKIALIVDSGVLRCEPRNIVYKISADYPMICLPCTGWESCKFKVDIYFISLPLNE